MAVPLLDLTAQNLALEGELKASFDRILKSGQFILGPDVQEFENEMREFNGVRHALGVSSGTDALLLALMTLDIRAGDEVLCPSFSFFATAGCVARVGATPVFVDSEPDSFNLDVTDAAKKLTERTRAIIPVHLFGQCADMDAVMNLAREHRLHVIEDAAQSLGARYKGRAAGSVGTFGAYSFFPSKNLGGLGDGGLLVCNDDALAEKARILRNHGAQPKYYHKYVGGNFRIDTLQAAFLRIKLRHLDTYNLARQANAAFYGERLSGLKGISVPRSQPEMAHIWNQYTIRITENRRDFVRTELLKSGIGSEVYYPVPLHRQQCFRDAPGDGSVADQLAAEVLSLPVYPELPEEHAEFVCKELRRICASPEWL